MTVNIRRCVRMQVLISASLDGEVGGRSARPVERHLAECPQCRAFKEHLLRLKTALRRQAETHEAPLGLWANVQQRLEQKNGLDERKAFPWAKRVLVPALGAAMVLALLLGLGVFRRGAELSPEALAAEFPKQGSLVPTSLNQPDARQAAAQMSQLVGFNVSPPDFTPCGFALVGAVTTEVNHAKGVSFVYRRGCEVVVVSQLKATPQLKRFNKTTAVRGKQAHYATVKDLKLVVWQEGERLMSISCSQQVFVGPMGGMNCH